MRLQAKKTVKTMKPVTPMDDSVPKFFRVYVTGISGDDMELPVSFNSYLPTPLPKHVTLESIYGKTWKMALRRCVGDVERYILLNGWKRIAKDESLTSGNVLEFEFDGSRCFNFCIYEPLTMCKRLGTTPVPRETEDADDVVVLSDDDEDDDDDDDDSQDADYNSADDNDIILDDDDDDDGVAADDDDVVAFDGSDDDDGDDDDDERQYLDDRSNAFFPVKINPKKKSQLRIPGPVIRDYGLNFSETESITLIDPLVKKFGKLSKEIKIQANGCVFIKGFGAVIRRNGVRSTDKMICEIKKAGRNNMVHTIKFHIIR